MRGGAVGVVLAAGLLSGCGLLAGREMRPPPPERGAMQEGIASWYGPGFHGRPTSSGEVYDQEDLTAAHGTLPLGTRVAVTNLRNQRSVEVRINDRGPFVAGRVIDLSYAAARSLDMVGPGTTPVRIEVLGFRGRTLPAAAYAVQVGSFADHRNAQNLQAALRRHFDGVYITVLDGAQQRHFRVRIGPFARREEAARTARRTAALGFAALVMEENPVLH